MSDYENDDGFDSDYEPALPEHDIAGQARAEGYELYQIGTGDLLIYDQATKKRVLTLSPALVVEVEELLEGDAVATTSLGEETVEWTDDGLVVDTPDGHIDGGRDLREALRAVLGIEPARKEYVFDTSALFSAEEQDEAAARRTIAEQLGVDPDQLQLQMVNDLD